MDRPDYLAAGEPARLIPVTADGNKELRAASILLATLSSVRPFAQELLGSLGQRIGRSEEHTSELQSLMRISYAVFCLNKKTHTPPAIVRPQPPYAHRSRRHLYINHNKR